MQTVDYTNQYMKLSVCHYHYGKVYYIWEPTLKISLQLFLIGNMNILLTKYNPKYTGSVYKEFP